MVTGEQLRVLAQEQAALRRVATLVARGATPPDVFAAVVEEVGRLLPVGFADMGRYEPGGTISFVAAWSGDRDQSPVGSRWRLEGKNLATIVYETGRPSRLDSYADASGTLGAGSRERGFRSAVATPIIVDGRTWGVVIAGSTRDEPMPRDTEVRLASFTDLLATAIANAESRAGLARLAEEQTALRRIATLVAHGTPPTDVFAAVIEEVGKLLPVDYARMVRCEPDGMASSVAGWGSAEEIIPTGSRYRVSGENLETIVARTGRPARLDDFAGVSGPIGIAVRKRGVRSAVATPIIVDGQLWGMIAAGSTEEESLPPDTEERLATFTELLATAIANAESRAHLAASRARVVAAADDARRQIQRDLHHGIRQELVSLGLQLRAVQAALPPQLGELERALSRIATGLASVSDELGEISRGIHPAVLSEKGLEPALRALAGRSAVPVELSLQVERRLPERVEVAAYYVVSEALTNTAKHAQASLVKVALEVGDTDLRLTIRDDGIGGATLGRGSGLVGLRDRIEALGGSLQVTSPGGEGTALLIGIPIGDPMSERAC
jgi:signal transduction histidine kinase